jgi:hypothetical protein
MIFGMRSKIMDAASSPIPERSLAEPLQIGLATPFASIERGLSERVNNSLRPSLSTN